MKKLAAILATLAVALGLPLAIAAPAQAWGTRSNCGVIHRHTNEWSTFFAHKTRVAVAACWKGPGRGDLVNHMVWTHRPIVSFPSKGIPSTESVKLVTAPHVVRLVRGSDVGDPGAGVVAVKYEWEVKVCGADIGPITGLCQTHPYTIQISSSATRICANFGGDACDVLKVW